MIIDDLHIRRAPARPRKANAPLIVDADAMLPSAVTFELLQAIPGRNPQEIERCSGVELSQLATRDGFNVCKSGDPPSLMQRFSIAALDIKYRHGTYRRSIHDKSQCALGRSTVDRRWIFPDGSTGADGVGIIWLVMRARARAT